MSLAASRLLRKLDITKLLVSAGELAVLIAVSIALLWPAPFSHNQLFAAWQDSDLILSHWPMALLIQRTFTQSHGLPLWNPYFGGGQPLAANPLAALFYPPTHLVHFFSVQDYFLLLMLGHLVWAGLGMLLLARRALGLPHLPALVAAVSYMATPPLLAHIGAGHITFVQTVAWYPWLALTCWETVRAPRRWGIALALCIALTLLAGHPQMAYYGLLMIIALAAWLLVKRAWLEGRRALLASIAGLLSAGIIGLLLAAVHLLPLIELTNHSTRQVTLIVYDAFPPPDFLHALIFPQPSDAHVWEFVISPGMVVLALALVAVVARIRTVWPLLLGGVVVAGLAMGNALSLYPHVARLLPGLDRFRDLARIWFIALVPFSLFAGLGADALVRGIQYIFQRVSQNVSLRSRGATVGGCLVVCVTAFSLIYIDIGYARIGDVSAITLPSALAQSASQLAGDGRIYDVQENIPQLHAVELQTSLADGYDPLLIQAYVAYMYRAGGFIYEGGYVLHFPKDSPTVQPDARLLGLMNVSVVVSTRPLADRRLVLLEEVDGTLIYRNTADAGPAYLVRPALPGNPPSLDSLQRLDSQVRVVAMIPEQDTFSFTSTSTAYLVLAMPAYPGWVAELDGRPAVIQQIAGVLPAIKVGPGTHTLRYSFAPSSVRNGALLSLLGVLATLAWLLVARFWKPKWHRAPEGS